MTTRKTKRRPADPPAQLAGLVTTALDDMKAINVAVLDVRGLTDIADTMVIASGNSDRHVRSIADRVIEKAKASGVRPFGVEGARDGEWVLVDLPDVMVHVMLPRVREHYALESLWESTVAPAAPAVKAAPLPKAAPLAKAAPLPKAAPLAKAATRRRAPAKRVAKSARSTRTPART
jgi:ribosome-associated protein